MSGGTSVGPNRLKNNQSNSAASGTENGGGEYVLLNYVKNDGGGNRADGIVVPKTSAPVKCPAFPASRTVNFASASVCGNVLRCAPRLSAEPSPSTRRR